ncbi:MAG: hypothetical protein DHS20C11_01340 [Lysobacteraceae bacterium]|nr:MAG: hypothetical protein DHS20C11_01340 [Xanthomonadaceae bacterium]
MASALIAAPIAAALEGWYEDPTTGCMIEVLDLPADYEVLWTGDCAQGLANGEGSIVVTDDGEVQYRYDGPANDGRAHGHGVYFEHTDDGVHRIVGQFVDGIIDGQAEYFGPDGSYFEGILDGNSGAGAGRASTPDGAEYEGEFLNLEPHGQGFMTFANGDMYRGQWLNGQRSGEGEILTTDGVYYKGKWLNDEPHGTGVAEFSEGRYEGPFSEGEPEGDGKFTDLDGNVYEGPFQDGQPNGTFVVTLADGAIESEIWIKGEKQQ